MKRLFTLSLILFTLKTFSQPTVTSAVMGNIGDEMTFSLVDADGFDPGPSGNNVTWDFTGITFTGASTGFTLMNVASTPYAADFPGANIAADAGIGNYAYFKLLATEYSNYGVGTAAVIVFYSDPEKIFEFPLSVGASHTDNLYSEFTSGVDFIRSGSVNTTTDAWGTIKLPSGVFTNVVRVKVVETYQDDADLLPSPIEYNFTNYYWFKNGVDGPLFTYAYMETTTIGSPVVTESANMNDYIVVSGIEDEFIQNRMQLFPNPCTDAFTVKAADMKKIELFNTLGEMVYQQAEINSAVCTISVDGLPAGIYLVQATTSNGVISSNIQIQ